MKRVGFVVGLAALGLWTISLCMDGGAGSAGGALLEGWSSSQASSGAKSTSGLREVSFEASKDKEEGRIKGKRGREESRSSHFPSFLPFLAVPLLLSFRVKDRSSSFRSPRDRCLLGTLTSRRDGAGEVGRLGEQSWWERGGRGRGRDRRILFVEYGAGNHLTLSFP